MTGCATWALNFCSAIKSDEVKWQKLGGQINVDTPLVLNISHMTTKDGVTLWVKSKTAIVNMRLPGGSVPMWKL